MECGLVYDRQKTCIEGHCSPREAEQRHYPWHAAVFRGNNRDYVCAGVLIHKEWVVTSATCARAAGSIQARLCVHLGSVSVRGSRDQQRIESPVIDVIDHPRKKWIKINFLLKSFVLSSLLFRFQRVLHAVRRSSLETGKAG